MSCGRSLPAATKLSRDLHDCPSRTGTNLALRGAFDLARLSVHSFELVHLVKDALCAGTHVRTRIRQSAFGYRTNLLAGRFGLLREGLQGEFPHLARRICNQDFMHPVDRDLGAATHRLLQTEEARLIIWFIEGLKNRYLSCCVIAGRVSD